MAVKIGVVFADMKQRAEPKMTAQVPLPPTPPPGSNVPPGPAPVRVTIADQRILAVLFGTYGVTREDLGEFLIARGGADKLDLYVNRRIIEIEASNRRLTITQEEIDAAFADDLRGLGLGQGIEDQAGISPAEAFRQMKTLFVTHLLPRYGKTLYEWTEDAIKPRLLLGKMCRDQVKVTDEDLQKAFENKFGQKRCAQIIIWPKEQFRQAQKQWDECRKSQEDFDRAARAQPDPNLASRAGHVLPMGKYTDAENSLLEQVLFSLKVGEVSQLFETPAGIVCIKCTRIDPPVTQVTFDKAKPILEKDVFERKLAKAVPACFGELKKKASPFILFKGPTPRENAEGVKHLIELAGVNVPKH